MQYSKTIYVLKNEFDRAELVVSSSIEFTDANPNCKINSVTLIETDYDENTFKVDITIDYEIV